jgi:hypothetical protein
MPGSARRKRACAAVSRPVTAASTGPVAGRAPPSRSAAASRHVRAAVRLRSAAASSRRQRRPRSRQWDVVAGSRSGSSPAASRSAMAAAKASGQPGASRSRSGGKCSSRSPFSSKSARSRAGRSASSPGVKSRPAPARISPASVAGPIRRVPASEAARPDATRAARSAWAWRSEGTSAVRRGKGPEAGRSATASAQSASDQTTGRGSGMTPRV